MDTSSAQVLRTPLTDLLKIKHPIMLAGMNNVSSADLAAAVSNAGGIGSIGGVFMTPKMLRKEIAKLKSQLVDKTCFGVDLLLPQVGGSARKTNYDYTEGALPELVEVIIESKARLFISAVGVPPKWVVDKLHQNGVLCMNMCGHPKHVKKAISVGIDIVCCQGYEGGGHTGEIGTMALIPLCVEAAKGAKSPLTGGPVHVVAAGGIFDGRGVAASLSLGAEAVWVGTRFIASKEATTSNRHKKSVVEGSATDTVRTLIYTGRPLRVIKTDIVNRWEAQPEKIKQLTSEGKLPVQWERVKTLKEGKPWSVAKSHALLVGQACGGVKSILSAKEIVDNLVHGAADILNNRKKLIVAKL
eukprot:TRINITY_DN846_c0_g2_i2.p1 TRINITY_DN846_c0_g2~~TRINITY_DN846_c0_g2_i2.p1  ORF type:complete len:357 (+),score=93.93 TRINITY_DN846_c0_g2_i2:70-1140(+)